jgi:hypothetical protein
MTSQRTQSLKENVEYFRDETKQTWELWGRPFVN